MNNIIELNEEIKEQQEKDKKSKEINDKIDGDTKRMEKLRDDFKSATDEEQVKILEEITAIQQNIEDINKELDISLDKKDIIKKNADFLKDFSKENILAGLIKTNNWYRDNNEQFETTATTLTSLLEKYPQNEKIKTLITTLKEGEIKNFQGIL
jgi:outer membrane PBP1 activator LpoA protein